MALIFDLKIPIHGEPAHMLKTLNKNPDVSILIVNTNNCEMSDNLLKSIYKQSIGFNFEIIFVDNASEDNSTEILSLKYPEINIIRNEERQGFASNYNKAIKKAHGEYVLLLNEDMLLLNNAINRMKIFLEKKSNVGAVGCKLLNSDMSLQLSAWINFPSLGTELFISSLAFLILNKIFGKKRYPYRYAMDVAEYDEPQKVSFLLGSCIMVRKQIIADVGLLDETTKIYREETDWCHRMKLQGWEIMYMPEGEIIHYGGGTIKRNSLSEMDLGLKAAYYYHEKYYGRTSVFLLALLYNIGAVIRISLHGFLYMLKSGFREENAVIIRNNCYLLLWHLRRMFFKDKI